MCCMAAGVSHMRGVWHLGVCHALGAWSLDMHRVRGVRQLDAGTLDGVRKALAVGCKTLAARFEVRPGDAKLDREMQGASCGMRGPTCKVRGLATGTRLVRNAGHGV